MEYGFWRAQARELMSPSTGNNATGPDSAPLAATGASVRPALRFNRHELAGAFGDLGTDLPLIVGMILASGLDAASVLIVFGSMQVLTGVVYRMPMPVQPLKAVAVLVITQKVAAGVLYGAGLAIGAVMLVLALSGALEWLARLVPKCVVRGIQFGLGVQLVTLAFREYVPAEGVRGWALAAAAFVLALALAGNRRLPSALAVVGLGLIYAVVFRGGEWLGGPPLALRLPQWHTPTCKEVWTGFLWLALPQIPLSLGNSILATRQLAADFFPERPLSVRRIGLTYSLMNLICPWLGGVPVCHGSGGMAGHYAFGARTGGSVVIYGACFTLAGLFLSEGFERLNHLFPLPVLGVLLLFEGWTLLTLVRDTATSKAEFMVAVLVGLMAGNLPYGYVIGIIVGTALHFLVARGRLGLGRP